MLATGTIVATKVIRRSGRALRSLWLTEMHTGDDGGEATTEQASAARDLADHGGPRLSRVTAETADAVRENEETLMVGKALGELCGVRRNQVGTLAKH